MGGFEEFVLFDQYVVIAFFVFFHLEWDEGVVFGVGFFE